MEMGLHGFRGFGGFAGLEAVEDSKVLVSGCGMDVLDVFPNDLSNGLDQVAISCDL